MWGLEKKKDHAKQFQMSLGEWRPGLEEQRNNKGKRRAIRQLARIFKRV